MANFRILYDYAAFDKATVTQSTDKERRRGPNVLLHHIGKKWATTSLTSQWIKFDLGSSKQITCLGIFGHNLTSVATVTLQANTSDSWGSPPFSQVLTLATDADSVVFPRILVFINQTYRWWRITLDDPTNSTGSIEVGRIIAGLYYEFTRNAARGVRVAHKDPSNIIHKEGTIENLDDFKEESRYRQIRAEFTWRDRTERRKIEAIFRKVGNVRPVVLAMDPVDRPSEESAYCWLISDLDWVWKHSDKFDVLTLVFEEKTR